ncbi:Kelch repeat-containing protein, partial [Gemmatimonadota bacterium]
PYTISDQEGSDVGLLAEFSMNDGVTWQVATVSGDTSGIVLADHDSSLVWQSRSDLLDQALTYGVQFRLTPYDPGGWGTADITLIDIDNLAPQGFGASGDAGASTITFWFDELVDKDTATNTSNFSLTGGLTAASINGTGAAEWSVKAPMPDRRWTASAGVINGKLYVAGGEDSDNNYTSTLFEYNPSTYTWATRTPMPTARGWAVAGVIDGKLYVAGGTNATDALSKLEVYDPSTNTWTTKTSMPNLTVHAAAGVIDGKLYVAGRQIGGIWYDTLVAYDPSTDSWTTLASMPTARVSAVAGVIDGKLYITGGSTTGDAFVSSLEVYDPSANSWSTLAPIPTDRNDAAAEVIDGKFYVAGGWNVSGTVADMEVYDPSTNTWTSQNPMPFPERHAVAGVIEGVLYLAGGEENDSQTLETYSALAPRFDLTLTSGQVLPDSSTSVTLTVSNISDIFGNTIATTLDTTFKPYFYDPTRPDIGLTALTGMQQGDISIQYLIGDVEGSPVSLLAEYSTDAGSTWQAASVSGDTIGIVAADYNNSLFWQSGTDLPDQMIFGVWLRLTPHDSGGWGIPDSISIDIDNLAPQSIGARAVAWSDSFEFWFDEPVVDARAMNTGNISITGLTVDTIEKVPNWVVEESNLIWRHAHAAVTVGRKIYLIGGIGDGGTDTHNSMEIFDLDTGQWELRGGYPINLNHGVWAVAVGNTIYAGGYEDRFYKYDLGGDTWTELTAVSGTGFAAAVVIDGLIYVAGGVDVQDEMDHLRIFNPTSETWSFGSSMLEPRHRAGHGVIDGKLYVAGGWNDSGEMISAEVYTPSTGTWENISPLPSPEGSAVGWALGDKLYAAGGDTLWVYDASDDAWSAVGRTPQNRVEHAITVFEGRAYTFGGIFESSQTTQVDSYDPINRYRAFLTTGQHMPESSINVGASNIDDLYGNSAGLLSVDFTPTDTNGDPTIALDAIDTEVGGDIAIGYTLTDIEGNPVNLSPRYSLDGGSSWLMMATDSDTVGITSDNYAGSIIWKSATDEPGLDNASVMIRIHAIDNAFETGNSDQITFHLDNNSVPALTISSGPSYSAVDTAWTIGYDLSDTESDTLALDAVFSLDAGATWNPAAVTGDTAGILSADYTGTLKWMVGRDVPAPGGGMVFRLTPRDNDPGISDEVALQAWNENAPAVTLSTSAVGEQSGDVVIEYQLSDLDNSTVSLAVEFATSGGTWSPATVTGATTGLTPSSGYDGSLTWQTATDLTGIDDQHVILRITPSDTETGTPDELEFHIDNNAVPVLAGFTTSGTARDITLTFTLTD